jgi:hypothetical protein
MMIPSMLYGRASAVRSRAKKKLAEVLETCDFEHLDCGPMLETHDVTGLLLLQPERIQTPGEHFHCYALTVAIVDLVDGSRMLATMDAWMKWSLAEAWRFLGVTDQYSTGPLDDNRSLLTPYVEAAVRFWPQLNSEGDRFGPMVNGPTGAWNMMDNLCFALANLGIPLTELRADPPGGPADFLERIAKSGALP